MLEKFVLDIDGNFRYAEAEVKMFMDAKIKCF